MASTFSDLGIELMATGENSGTWGDKTNSNLNLVQQAIAGYQEVSIAGGAQTTGNQIVTIPNSIEKTYTIINGTSGSFTVQFKTVSGTGFTFSTTDKGSRMCYSDGTNVVDINALFNTINQFRVPTADGNSGDAIITDGSSNLSFSNLNGKAIAYSLIFS